MKGKGFTLTKLLTNTFLESFIAENVISVVRYDIDSSDGEEYSRHQVWELILKVMKEKYKDSFIIKDNSQIGGPLEIDLGNGGKTYGMKLFVFNQEEMMKFIKRIKEEKSEIEMVKE